LLFSDSAREAFARRVEDINKAAAILTAKRLAELEHAYEERRRRLEVSA
jgi:hypothetical protein